MKSPTVTRIEDKLTELRQQLVQLQANANAIAGAIQLAEQLLKEEEAPVSEPV